MPVKSSGMAQGLANAWPPGQYKICKCPTSGTDKEGKCPAVAWGGVGGCWVQVELTDALSVTGINAIDLLMVLEAKHDS